MLPLLLLALLLIAGCRSPVAPTPVGAERALPMVRKIASPVPELRNLRVWVSRDSLRFECVLSQDSTGLAQVGGWSIGVAIYTQLEPNGFDVTPGSPQYGTNAFGAVEPPHEAWDLICFADDRFQGVRGRVALRVTGRRLSIAWALSDMGVDWVGRGHWVVIAHGVGWNDYWQMPEWRPPQHEFRGIVSELNAHSTENIPLVLTNGR